MWIDFSTQFSAVRYLRENIIRIGLNCRNHFNDTKIVGLFTRKCRQTEQTKYCQRLNICRRKIDTLHNEKIQSNFDFVENEIALANDSDRITNWTVLVITHVTKYWQQNATVLRHSILPENLNSLVKSYRLSEQPTLGQVLSLDLK